MSDGRTEAITGFEVCGAGAKDSDRHAAWHREVITQAVEAAEAEQERKGPVSRASRHVAPISTQLGRHGQ